MVFLWIFLPVVLVAGLIVRRPKYQNIVLLAASLIFYAWGEPRHILLLLFSIFMNWALGMLIAAFPARKRLFLVLDIIGNLGLLGYFKYCNFALNTLDHLLPFVHLPRTNIILPIGISFFTFQAMSYVIDLYRGEYPVQKNPLNLALYISFFPQLIAGPIVRYIDVERQIENREVTPLRIAEGMRRFLYGLGKKVILANILASPADALFAIGSGGLTSASAWLAAVLYSLQLYYDFSGYSDMAIGLGRMFGFDFLENFNYPYLSASIGEFWRRWHISLGTWFREYLYIPLGGNRRGKLRTNINLFIVFALTGLWHGASWNFVGWGIYHGIFQILERIGLAKLLKKSRVLSHIYTCVVFIVGWVFFRVESGAEGIRIVQRMFMPWKYTVSTVRIGKYFTNQAILVTVIAVLGCGLFQAAAGRIAGGKLARAWKNSLAESLFLAVVLFLSILLLAGNTYNPFIYFRF